MHSVYRYNSKSVCILTCCSIRCTRDPAAMLLVCCVHLDIAWSCAPGLLTISDAGSPRTFSFIISGRVGGGNNLFITLTKKRRTDCVVLSEGSAFASPKRRPSTVEPKKMFRIAGAERSPDKATVEEEKKKAKQNVWFTVKVFVAYVALLRLGKFR